MQYDYRKQRYKLKAVYPIYIWSFGIYHFLLTDKGSDFLFKIVNNFKAIFCCGNENKKARSIKKGEIFSVVPIIPGSNIFLNDFNNLILF